MKAWVGACAVFLLFSGCKVRNHNDSDFYATNNKEYVKNSCPTGYIRKKIRELKVSSLFDWRNFTSAKNLTSEQMCKPIVNESKFGSLALEPKFVGKMWEDLEYTKVGFNENFAASCVESSLSKIPENEKSYYNSLSAAEKKRVRRNIVSDIYYLTRILQDSVRSRTEIIGGLRQVLGKETHVSGRISKYASIEKFMPGSIKHAKQVDKCPADPDGMTVVYAQSELTLKMYLFSKIMAWRVSKHAQENPNLGLPKNLFPADLKVNRTDFKSVLEFYNAEAERYKIESPWFNDEGTRKYFSIVDEETFKTNPKIGSYDRKVVGKHWFPKLSSKANQATYTLNNKIFSGDMYAEPSNLVDYINARLNGLVQLAEFKEDIVKYMYALIESHDASIKQSWQVAACAWSNDFDKCDFDKSVIHSTLSSIPDYPLVFRAFEEITGTKFKDKFQDKWRENLSDKALSSDKQKIDFMDYEYSGAMCRYRINALSHEVHEGEAMFYGGVLATLIPTFLIEPMMIGALTAARTVVAGDRVAIALSQNSNKFFIHEWNTAFRAKIYQKTVPIAKSLEKLVTPTRVGVLGANIAVNQYFINEGFRPLKDYCEKLLSVMETKNDNLRQGIFRPFDPTEAMCVSVGGDTKASQSSTLKPFTDRLFSNQISKDSQSCRLMMGMAMTFGVVGIAADTFGILHASTYLKQLPIVRKLAGTPGLMR